MNRITMNNANEQLDFSGPLNLSTNEHTAGTENVLMELMDCNRIASSDINEIPAQLEEILKNVYDLTSVGKDFNGPLNSTMHTTSDSKLFDTNTSSSGNDFSMSFNSDSSLYITPQSNISSSSSGYFTPNVHGIQNNYQVNPTYFYNKSENCENYVGYLYDQPKSYSTTAVRNAQDDDNDSSPVYLNFNIHNIAPSVQTFNTEFEKYTHQIVGNPAIERKGNEVNCDEYLNNLEEVWQPQLVEINAKRNQVFRPVSTNTLSSSKKFPTQKLYSFPQDITKLNGVLSADVMSVYQPLNNNTPSNNFSATQQSSTENVERQIVTRNPLQTRLSVKIKNSEWAFINEKNNNDNNETQGDISTDAELLAIDQTDPDIPFIKERPRGRKRRKQSLTPLTDNDISFMNAKGEFSKFEPANDYFSKDIKIPTDTAFITFRKKSKNHSSDNISENSSLAGRNDSFASQLQRDITVNSSISSTIVVSSDSDSENDSESSDAKCLKCRNCKKMFKTSRSYSIHKKRCDAPEHLDNTYVLEVEYLESEKDDDFDQDSDSDEKDIKYHSESLEIVESDSVDSLDLIKQEILDEPERSDGQVLRRNTRSSSTKMNNVSNSTIMMSSSSKKFILKKPSKKLHTSQVDTKQINMPCCEICGKKFRQKSYLVAHKRVHQKNFKCQYCLKTFLIKTAYETHVLEKCEKIPPVKLKTLRSAVNNIVAK